MEKCKKSQTKTMNLKYELQHGMKSLNYLMGLNLYQNSVFKIILNISAEKTLLILLYEYA